jgi:hypothetical protein
MKYLRRATSGAAGNGLLATIKYLHRTTSAAAVNGLGTTIKCLRGAAGIDLGATIQYLRRTTRQRPGHHGQVPATHKERRRGQRPKPVPGISDVPLHHKRPVFALFCAYLLCQQRKRHCRGPVFMSPVFVCVGPELSRCVFN